MIVLLSLILITAFLLIPATIVGMAIYLKPKKVDRPTRSEAELIKIIYDSIEREWTYRVRFHFKLKKIDQPNFEWELDYLTKRVIKSLAPGIREELGYYYTEDALILLVSHMIQILLLDYLDKHKPVSSAIRR